MDVAAPDGATSDAVDAVDAVDGSPDARATRGNGEMRDEKLKTVKERRRTVFKTIVPSRAAPTGRHFDGGRSAAASVVPEEPHPAGSPTAPGLSTRGAEPRRRRLPSRTRARRPPASTSPRARVRHREPVAVRGGEPDPRRGTRARRPARTTRVYRSAASARRRFSPNAAYRQAARTSRTTPRTMPRLGSPESLSWDPRMSSSCARRAAPARRARPQRVPDNHTRAAVIAFLPPPRARRRCPVGGALHCARSDLYAAVPPGTRVAHHLGRPPTAPGPPCCSPGPRGADRRIATKAAAEHTTIQSVRA